VLHTRSLGAFPWTELVPAFQAGDLHFPASHQPPKKTNGTQKHGPYNGSFPSESLLVRGNLSRGTPGTSNRRGRVTHGGLNRRNRASGIFRRRKRSVRIGYRDILAAMRARGANSGPARLSFDIFTTGRTWKLERPFLGHERGKLNPARRTSYPPAAIMIRHPHFRPTARAYGCE
jgi:hypothetical protein